MKVSITDVFLIYLRLLPSFSLFLSIFLSLFNRSSLCLYFVFEHLFLLRIQLNLNITIEIVCPVFTSCSGILSSSCQERLGRRRRNILLNFDAILRITLRLVFYEYLAGCLNTLLLAPISLETKSLSSTSVFCCATRIPILRIKYIFTSLLLSFLSFFLGSASVFLVQCLFVLHDSFIFWYGLTDLTQDFICK